MDNKTESQDNVLENAVPEEATVSNDESVAKPERKNETLESKLRKFKRQSSGIVAEIRKREAYEKPSVKRKKKSKEARRRNKKSNSNRW